MIATRIRRHYRSVALIALLAASGTTLAAAPGPAPAPRLLVGANVPCGADELDPVLQQWFKEQDALLDGILVRLGRIEILVGELQRLIKALPVPAAAPVTAPLAQAPLPDSTAAPASMPEWAVPLAGGTLTAILLIWWARRRSASPQPTKAKKPAATAAVMPPAAQPAAPAQPASAPVVAEIPPSQQDQAIELAEIMLSMGLGHGAAQTLLEQIRHEPKQALRQWLKLLEIYRKNDQQEEFQRSAEELRLYFNVRPQDWHAAPDSQRSVEDYPHIAARLTELWGTPACLSYMKHLLDDNRGGARTGFPQAVAEELLLLVALLRAADIVQEPLPAAA